MTDEDKLLAGLQAFRETYEACRTESQIQHDKAYDAWKKLDEEVKSAGPNVHHFMPKAPSIYVFLTPEEMAEEMRLLEQELEGDR